MQPEKRRAESMVLTTSSYASPESSPFAPSTKCWYMPCLREVLALARMRRMVSTRLRASSLVIQPRSTAMGNEASWKPTPAMIKRSPEKYARYADGMAGGPDNPLGARAIYLYQGKHDTSIRIHGTTQPWTIGKAASNGCFRMVNEHVIDLYERVPIGTKVTVI